MTTRTAASSVESPSHFRKIPASAPGPQAKLKEVFVSEGMESARDGVLKRGTNVWLMLSI